MRHKGYGAVGMKDVVAASGAPIGSLYHHFPGGKVQLARQALINAGKAYALLIPTLTNPFDDLGEAIEALFAQAAADMEQTNFANMCPVATVAAEVADTVEDLREATAGIFTSWLYGGTEYFRYRGLPESTARDVTVVLISALEGAFILARTLRSTEPLLATGRVLAPQYRGVALRAQLASIGPTSTSTAGSRW